ncbi:hypothetical protein D9M68_906220 [compost metagenome]
MAFEGNAIDGRFHCRVQQFDDQRQQTGTDHQRAFATTDIKEERQRNQHHIKQYQLAEGSFAGEGGTQAVERIASGIQDAF